MRTLRWVLVASAFAAPLHAQSARMDCVREQIANQPAGSLGAWAALVPQAVSARMDSLRATGRWSAMVDSLRAIYSAAPADLSPLSPAQRAALSAQLDSLRMELAAGEADPAALLLGKVTDRFGIDADDGSYTLFFGRPVTQVVVNDATPEATRRAVCWLGFAASDVIAQYRNPALRALSAALTARSERWDNFMNHGYSMLPHEVLVNGLLPRASLEPPSFQLLLVHASPATQIVTSSLRALRSATREDVLAVEPLGGVFYTATRAHYYGASWIVTFPTEGGMGTGVMLHSSRIGHLAYIWRHRDADGKRRNGFLVSIDLYGHLTDAADKWKKLRDEARTTCTQAPAACLNALAQQ